MTGQVQAENLSARATVGVLEDTRSITDVRVHVWEPGGDRWRLLTLAEQRMLWGFRGSR